MKKILIIACLFFVAAFSKTIDNESLRDVWSTWKLTYSKHYTPEEEEFKFSTFCDNYRKITKLNEENPDAQMALNKFADLSSEEFRDKIRQGGVPEDIIKVDESRNKEDKNDQDL